MENFKENNMNSIVETEKNDEGEDGNANVENGKEKFPETEIKDWEQYFFTENVLAAIVDSLVYEENIVCLCTPAVADAFWRYKGKSVVCLDIDERFGYLPGFMKYDLLNPVKIDIIPNILIIDPPFFQIKLVDLLNCVDVLTNGNKSTKIIFAFIKREEKALLSIFKSYNLKISKFKLEYKSVDPTKWNNYGIYINFESNKFKYFDKLKKK
jgi:hypothetical protein